jgi:hypothetical protein
MTKMKNFEVPIGFPTSLSFDFMLGTNFKVSNSVLVLAAMKIVLAAV